MRLHRQKIECCLLPESRGGAIFSSILYDLSRSHLEIRQIYLRRRAARRNSHQIVRAMAATRFIPLLSRFPSVSHAFAYGSGVMHQPGLYTPEPSTSGRDTQSNAPMVDLIFAVEDCHAWHTKVRPQCWWLLGAPSHAHCSPCMRPPITDNYRYR